MDLCAWRADEGAERRVARDQREGCAVLRSPLVYEIRGAIAARPFHVLRRDGRGARQGLAYMACNDAAPQVISATGAEADDQVYRLASKGADLRVRHGRVDQSHQTRAPQAVCTGDLVPVIPCAASR